MHIQSLNVHLSYPNYNIPIFIFISPPLASIAIKEGISLGTQRRAQIHAVIVRDEAVKNGGELAEVILKLLLPLFKSMDAITGRKGLKLTT
jgi:hypothetical protein